MLHKRGVNRLRERQLQGLTIGSVKMGLDSRAWSRCVVAGDKLPCWLPHCSALGLEVVRVCLKSDEFLKIVEKQVADACVIQLGELPARFPLALVVLIDGPALNSLLVEASQSEAKIVMSMQERQRAAQGMVGTDSDTLLRATRWSDEQDPTLGNSFSRWKFSHLNLKSREAPDKRREHCSASE
jgi:hypothetical protein